MKRGKIDIIKDILEILRVNHGQMNYTPLLRATNLSSSRFSEYFAEILEKGFVAEKREGKSRVVCLKSKGREYLEKYRAIVGFIEEFDL